MFSQLTLLSDLKIFATLVTLDSCAIMIQKGRTITIYWLQIFAVTTPWCLGWTSARETKAKDSTHSEGYENILGIILQHILVHASDDITLNTDKSNFIEIFVVENEVLRRRGRFDA